MQSVQSMQSNEPPSVTSRQRLEVSSEHSRKHSNHLNFVANDNNEEKRGRKKNAKYFKSLMLHLVLPFDLVVDTVTNSSFTGNTRFVTDRLTPDEPATFGQVTYAKTALFSLQHQRKHFRQLFKKPQSSTMCYDKKMQIYAAMQQDRCPVYKAVCY